VTRRIIQFSTGNVGIHSLRSIIERPDLELVGVHGTRAGQDRGVTPRTYAGSTGPPECWPPTTSTR